MNDENRANKSGQTKEEEEEEGCWDTTTSGPEVGRERERARCKQSRFSTAVVLLLIVLLVVVGTTKYNMLRG